MLVERFNMNEERKQKLDSIYYNDWYVRQSSIIANRANMAVLHELLHGHFSVIFDSLSSKSWIGYTKHKIDENKGLGAYLNVVESDAKQSEIALSGALNASIEWERWVNDKQDWQELQWDIWSWKSGFERLSYNYDNGNSDPGYADFLLNAETVGINNNKLFCYSTAMVALKAGFNYSPDLLYDLTYAEKFDKNKKELHHSITGYGDINKVKARFRNYSLLSFMAKVSGAGYLANLSEQDLYIHSDYAARCNFRVKDNYDIADKKRQALGMSSEFVPPNAAKVKKTNEAINEKERIL